MSPVDNSWRDGHIRLRAELDEALAKITEHEKAWDAMRENVNDTCDDAWWFDQIFYRHKPGKGES